MKTWLLLMPLLIGMTAIANAATEATSRDELQTLTGTLRESSNSEFKYYLQIEGMAGTMNLTGEILRDFKPGAFIQIRGIIKTKSSHPQSDASLQQAPVSWIVFMEVREANAIELPRPGEGNQ